MDDRLARRLDVAVETHCAHGRDAAVSVFAAGQGLTGNWRLDLDTLPAAPDERIVSPCGTTRYFWPP